MLDVSKDTVISEPEIIELVAVKVIDEPAFSAIVEALADKVMVGAASSSTIVTVLDVSVSSHNSNGGSIGVRVILIVSSISEIESSVGSMEKVAVSPLTVTSAIVA